MEEVKGTATVTFKSLAKVCEESASDIADIVCGDLAEEVSSAYRQAGGVIIGFAADRVPEAESGLPPEHYALYSTQVDVQAQNKARADKLPKVIEKFGLTPAVEGVSTSKGVDRSAFAMDL